MICPNCNAVVGDSMKFCENCGTPLSANVSQSFVGSQENPQTGATAQGAQPYSNPNYEVGNSAQQETASPYAYAQQPSDNPNAYAQQPGQPTAGGPYAATTPPGVYAPAGNQASTAPFVLAIIALVTSLLCLFPVSIILAIIALVMNSGQKKRGEISTKQTPTTVMSVISLVISAIVLVFTILLSSAILAYFAAETIPTSATSAPFSSAASSNSAISSDSSSGASQSQAPTTAEAARNLAGTWKLTGLVSKGSETKPENIELMQEMGLTVELVLGENGDAKFALFGTNLSGSWTQPDSETVVLDLEGETVQMTISGNDLTFINGNDTMTFSKQE